jgi:hypothetical protein
VEPAVVNRNAVVRDATRAEPFLAGAVAAALPFALLIQMLVSLRDYRQPAVPAAVWLGIAAAAAWLVPRSRHRGLTAP